MRSLVLVLGLVLLACSSEETGDPGGADGGSSGAPVENCLLRDDNAGQYSDSCVSRSFVEEYAGTYQRPPNGNVVVRQESGKLIVGGGQGGGTTIVFYGRDVAYAIAGSYTGSPYEFVRTSDGSVGWIRVNGRIAKRDRTA